MLRVGEKVHAIQRRISGDEPVRHLVGEVSEATSTTARVEAYEYFFDPTRNQFVRHPHRRTRIVSLTDAANLVTVLDGSPNLDALTLQVTVDRRVILTDGQSFQLQINDLGTVARPAARMTREL